MRLFLRNCGILLLLPALSLFAQRGGHGIPPANPNVLEKWDRMSTEQRQRSLEKLPPERRKQVESLLDHFNQLPPGEQRRLRQRYERFRALPPETQQLIRTELNRFRRLAPQRRQGVRREFTALRALPDADRNARMQSEEFRNRFSPDEQKMIRDLVENVPQVPQ